VRDIAAIVIVFLPILLAAVFSILLLRVGILNTSLIKELEIGARQPCFYCCYCMLLRLLVGFGDGLCLLLVGNKSRVMLLVSSRVPSWSGQPQGRSSRLAGWLAGSEGGSKLARNLLAHTKPRVLLEVA
jgi:hypothetical protein